MATDHNFRIKNGLEVGGTLIVNSSGQLRVPTVSSNINLLDSIRLNIGTGSDLAIFHTGSNGVIHNTTGELRIRSNTLKIQDFTNEDLMIVANSNSSVDLYHNNQKKLATTSTGIDVTGSLKIGGTQAIDSSRRFYPANIQNTTAIAFLNGSSAQGISVRDIYAGTTYANRTGAAGTIDALNGFKVAGTTVISSARLVENVTLDYGQTGARPVADGWHYDSGGTKRFYFDSAGAKTAYFGTGSGYVFRNSSDQGKFTISSTGGINLGGGDTLVTGTTAIAYNGTAVLDTSRNLVNIGTISSAAITASGNSVFTGASGSTGNAFVVVRGNNGTTQALRVHNTGEVVVGGNYLYASHTGTAFYSQGQAVFRNGILNDGGDLEVRDNLNITTSGVLKMSGTTVLDTSRNLTNIGTIGGTGISTGANLIDLFSNQNGVNELRLDNNRQDLSNVAVSKVSGRNSVEVANMTFYRGGGGNSGFIRFQNKPTNASSLTDVFQVGDGGTVGYGVNIITGGLRMNNTEVIDSSRNLTNINNITSAGFIRAASSGNRIELGTDGNIEITRTAGGAYIDFKNSSSEDFDQRIQATTIGHEFSGTIAAPTLRLTATGDAALGSTAHPFQVGATSGANIIIDSNEIMARSNGSQTTLHLNADGGNVAFRGNSSGTVNLTMSGTTFMDQNRNFTNIGTIVSGNLAITGGSGGNGQIDITRTSGASGRLQAQAAKLRFGVVSNHPLELTTNDTGRLTIANSGAITFNNAYTFPTSDGSANQVLQTNGSGQLSFATVQSGGGTITGASNMANNRVLTADGSTTINAESTFTYDGNVLQLTGSPTADLALGTYGSTNQGILYLRGSTANKQSVLKTTNGNLHIDSNSGNSIYLNYYSGSGIAFGTGSGGTAAWMGLDGDLWKGSGDNSGSKYWHAGNDGSGSGLDADTLDGLNSTAFLRSGASDIIDSHTSGSNLQGSYFLQGWGDADHSNNGPIGDFLRYKDATLWGYNGSSWTNLGNCDGVLDGNYAHQYGGLTLSQSYQEFVIDFGANLGYSFPGKFRMQHSTNGNTMAIYLETKESITNGYESGYTTETTISGVGSWPGETVTKVSFGVGSSYRNNFRIRIVPTWSHASNSITIGGIQLTGFYGSITKAYITTHDRAFNVLESLQIDGTTVFTNARQLANVASLDSTTIGAFEGQFLRSNANDTASGKITFTAAESVELTGIRGAALGSQTGDFIQMYERVHIGSPAGWGHSSTAAPSGGLSVYGGVNVATSGSGTLTRNSNTVWDAGNDGAGSGLDADTLDGMQPKSATGSAGSNQILRTHSNGYLYMQNWIDVGSAGLYSSTYGPHWYANGTNGWFHRSGNSTTSRLAMSNNSNTVMGYFYAESDNDIGILNNSAAWLLKCKSNGNLYKGDEAGLIWHSANDGSGSGLDADTVDGKHKDFLMHYKGVVSGNWDTIFSQTDGHMGVYEVQNITGGSHSNYPTGAYGYGGVLSWQLDNSTFKMYAPHTGSLFIQNGWNNDEYSGWRKVWDSGNDGSGSGLDADLLDGVQGSSFLRSDAQDNGAQSAANYLNLQYLYNNKLLIANGTTSFTDAYNDSPWYGIGRTNVPGYNGSGYNKAQIAFYWGLTLRSAQARIELSPAANGPINFGDGGTSNWAKINSTGIYQGTSNLVWHAGNDGAGSGLDADTVDGVQLANLARTDIAETFTNNLAVEGNLYIGAGSNDGYFFSDTNGRTAFANGDFYIQNSVTNYYNYATNQYIGDSSGDNIHFRANVLDGTGWSINGAGKFSTRDIQLESGYVLMRSNHNSGHLEGSYNNVGGNSTKSNPIYTIGSSYNPGESALSNMYGIGYSHSDASFYGGTGVSGWGMYVAADGDARVFLGGSNGVISSTGQHYVGTNVVWNAGNDGSGSGLDADTLDGLELHNTQGTQNTANQIIRTQNNGYTMLGWINTTSGATSSTLQRIYCSQDGYIRYQTPANFGVSISPHINYNTIANTPTIPTNNNQLTNGAGYITASNGAITNKLPLAGGTMTGNLVLDSGTNTLLNVKCDNAGEAIVRAGGDGQGTGAFEVSQDNGSHGGGMSYNGDGSPAFASGETNDYVTFYRINAGTRYEVFSYPYSGNQVYFNDWTYYPSNYGNRTTGDWIKNQTAHGYIQIGPANTSHAHIYTDRSNFYFNKTLLYASGNLMWHAANDGAGSGLDADLLDGLHASSFARTTATASINMQNFSITNLNDLSFNDPGVQEGIKWNGGSLWQIYESPNNQTNAAGNLQFTSGSGNGTIRMTLDTSSNLTVTGDVVAFSDEKLKDNIKVIENPIEKVKQIRGVTFTRNDLEDERKHTGVIAQEVEKVLPEVVLHDKDTDIKTVAYGNMVGLLVEAIKEQQETINKLTDRINDLEKKEK